MSKESLARRNSVVPRRDSRALVPFPVNSVPTVPESPVPRVSSPNDSTFPRRDSALLSPQRKTSGTGAASGRLSAGKISFDATPVGRGSIAAMAKRKASTSGAEQPPKKKSIPGAQGTSNRKASASNVEKGSHRESFMAVSKKPSAETGMGMMVGRSQDAAPDVIDVVVGDMVFHVPRALLTQHSPFFKRTLEKPENTHKSKLKLSGVTAETFQTLLQYMKTGQINVHQGNVADVFNAAFRLHMSEVVKRCIQMETEATPMGQQILMYAAARRLALHDEERRAFSFLTNHFSAVVSAKEFLEMDVEDVAELLNSDNLACHCEMEVFEACMRWLEYMPESRMRHTEKLLGRVRLTNLNLSQLHLCLEHTAIVTNPIAKRVIMDTILLWLNAEKEKRVLPKRERNYGSRDRSQVDGSSCNDPNHLLHITVPQNAALDRAYYESDGSFIEEETQERRVYESRTEEIRRIRRRIPSPLRGVQGTESKLNTESLNKSTSLKLYRKPSESAKKVSLERVYDDRERQRHEQSSDLSKQQQFRRMSTMEKKTSVDHAPGEMTHYQKDMGRGSSEYSLHSVGEMPSDDRMVTAAVDSARKQSMAAMGQIPSIGELPQRQETTYSTAVSGDLLGDTRRASMQSLKRRESVASPQMTASGITKGGTGSTYFGQGTVLEEVEEQPVSSYFEPDTVNQTAAIPGMASYEDTSGQPETSDQPVADTVADITQQPVADTMYFQQAEGARDAVAASTAGDMQNYYQDSNTLQTNTADQIYSDTIYGQDNVIVQRGDTDMPSDPVVDDTISAQQMESNFVAQNYDPTQQQPSTSVHVDDQPESLMELEQKPYSALDQSQQPGELGYLYDNSGQQGAMVKRPSQQSEHKITIEDAAQPSDYEPETPSLNVPTGVHQSYAIGAAAEPMFTDLAGQATKTGTSSSRRFTGTDNTYGIEGQMTSGTDNAYSGVDRHSKTTGIDQLPSVKRESVYALEHKTDRKKSTVLPTEDQATYPTVLGQEFTTGPTVDSAANRRQSSGKLAQEGNRKFSTSKASQDAQKRLSAVMQPGTLTDPVEKQDSIRRMSSQAKLANQSDSSKTATVTAFTRRASSHLDAAKLADQISRPGGLDTAKRQISFETRKSASENALSTVADPQVAIQVTTQQGIAPNAINTEEAYVIQTTRLIASTSSHSVEIIEEALIKSSDLPPIEEVSHSEVSNPNLSGGEAVSRANSPGIHRTRVVSDGAAAAVEIIMERKPATLEEVEEFKAKGNRAMIKSGDAHMMGDSEGSSTDEDDILIAKIPREEIDKSLDMIKQKLSELEQAKEKAANQKAKNSIDKKIFKLRHRERKLVKRKFNEKADEPPSKIRALESQSEIEFSSEISQASGTHDTKIKTHFRLSQIPSQHKNQVVCMALTPNISFDPSPLLPVMNFGLNRFILQQNDPIDAGGSSTNVRGGGGSNERPALQPSPGPSRVVKRTLISENKVTSIIEKKEEVRVKYDPNGVEQRDCHVESTTKEESETKKEEELFDSLDPKGNAQLPSSSSGTSQTSLSSGKSQIAPIKTFSFEKKTNFFTENKTVPVEQASCSSLTAAASGTKQTSILDVTASSLRKEMYGKQGTDATKIQSGDVVEYQRAVVPPGQAEMVNKPEQSETELQRVTRSILQSKKAESSSQSGGKTKASAKTGDSDPKKLLFSGITEDTAKPASSQEQNTEDVPQLMPVNDKSPKRNRKDSIAVTKLRLLNKELGKDLEDEEDDEEEDKDSSRKDHPKKNEKKGPDDAKDGGAGAPLIGGHNKDIKFSPPSPSSPTSKSRGSPTKNVPAKQNIFNLSGLSQESTCPPPPPAPPVPQRAVPKQANVARPVFSPHSAKTDVLSELKARIVQRAVTPEAVASHIAPLKVKVPPLPPPKPNIIKNLDVNVVIPVKITKEHFSAEGRLQKEVSFAKLPIIEQLSQETNVTTPTVGRESSEYDTSQDEISSVASQTNFEEEPCSTGVKHLDTIAEVDQQSSQKYYIDDNNNAIDCDTKIQEDVENVIKSSSQCNINKIQTPSMEALVTKNLTDELADNKKNLSHKEQQNMGFEDPNAHIRKTESSDKVRELDSVDSVFTASLNKSKESEKAEIYHIETRPEAIPSDTNKKDDHSLKNISVGKKVPDSLISLKTSDDSAQIALESDETEKNDDSFSEKGCLSANRPWSEINHVQSASMLFKPESNVLCNTVSHHDTAGSGELQMADTTNITISISSGSFSSRHVGGSQEKVYVARPKSQDSSSVEPNISVLFLKDAVDTRLSEKALTADGLFSNEKFGSDEIVQVRSICSQPEIHSANICESKDCQKVQENFSKRVTQSNDNIVIHDHRENDSTIDFPSIPTQHVFSSSNEEFVSFSALSNSHHIAEEQKVDETAHVSSHETLHDISLGENCSSQSHFPLRDLEAVAKSKQQEYNVGGAISDDEFVFQSVEETSSRSSNIDDDVPKFGSHSQANTVDKNILKLSESTSTMYDILGDFHGYIPITESSRLSCNLTSTEIKQEVTAYQETSKDAYSEILKTQETKVIGTRRFSQTPSVKDIEGEDKIENINDVLMGAYTNESCFDGGIATSTNTRMQTHSSKRDSWRTLNQRQQITNQLKVKETEEVQYFQRQKIIKKRRREEKICHETKSFSELVVEDLNTSSAITAPSTSFGTTSKMCKQLHMSSIGGQESLNFTGQPSSHGSQPFSLEESKTSIKAFRSYSAIEEFERHPRSAYDNEHDILFESSVVATKSKLLDAKDVSSSGSGDFDNQFITVMRIEEPPGPSKSLDKAPDKDSQDIVPRSASDTASHMSSLSVPQTTNALASASSSDVHFYKKAAEEMKKRRGSAVPPGGLSKIASSQDDSASVQDYTIPGELLRAPRPSLAPGELLKNGSRSQSNTSILHGVPLDSKNSVTKLLNIRTVDATGQSSTSILERPISNKTGAQTQFFVDGKGNMPNVVLFETRLEVYGKGRVTFSIDAVAEDGSTENLPGPILALPSVTMKGVTKSDDDVNRGKDTDQSIVPDRRTSAPGVLSSKVPKILDSITTATDHTISPVNLSVESAQEITEHNKHIHGLHAHDEKKPKEIKLNKPPGSPSKSHSGGILRHASPPEQAEKQKETKPDDKHQFFPKPTQSPHYVPQSGTLAVVPNKDDSKTKQLSEMLPKQDIVPLSDSAQLVESGEKKSDERLPVSKSVNSISKLENKQDASKAEKPGLTTSSVPKLEQRSPEKKEAISKTEDQSVTSSSVPKLEHKLPEKKEAIGSIEEPSVTSSSIPKLEKKSEKNEAISKTEEPSVTSSSVPKLEHKLPEKKEAISSIGAPSVSNSSIPKLEHKSPEKNKVISKTEDPSVSNSSIPKLEDKSDGKKGVIATSSSVPKLEHKSSVNKEASFKTKEPIATSSVPQLGHQAPGKNEITSKAVEVDKLHQSGRGVPAIEQIALPSAAYKTSQIVEKPRESATKVQEVVTSSRNLQPCAKTSKEQPKKRTSFTETEVKKSDPEFIQQLEPSEKAVSIKPKTAVEKSLQDVRSMRVHESPHRVHPRLDGSDGSGRKIVPVQSLTEFSESGPSSFTTAPSSNRKELIAYELDVLGYIKDDVELTVKSERQFFRRPKSNMASETSEGPSFDSQTTKTLTRQAVPSSVASPSPKELMPVSESSSRAQSAFLYSPSMTIDASARSSPTSEPRGDISRMGQLLEFDINKQVFPESDSSGTKPSKLHETTLPADDQDANKELDMIWSHVPASEISSRPLKIHPNLFAEPVEQGGCGTPVPATIPDVETQKELAEIWSHVPADRFKTMKLKTQPGKIVGTPNISHSPIIGNLETKKEKESLLREGPISPSKETAESSNQESFKPDSISPSMATHWLPPKDIGYSANQDTRGELVPRDSVSNVSKQVLPRQAQTSADLEKASHSGALSPTLITHWFPHIKDIKGTPKGFESSDSRPTALPIIGPSAEHNKPNKDEIIIMEGHEVFQVVKPGLSPEVGMSALSVVSSPDRPSTRTANTQTDLPSIAVDSRAQDDFLPMVLHQVTVNDQVP